MAMHSALLQLADGRFPAGGHAYSAGVEAAVSIGDVCDLAMLERYLAGRLAVGVVDASFAAATAAAVTAGRPLAPLDDEYSARTLSPRLREVSRQLGRQLVRAAAPIWVHPTLDLLAADDVGPHAPIATGAVTSAAGGSPHDAALLAYHHLAGAVTSAAIRLLGLDPVAVAAVQARAVVAVDLSADTVVAWTDANPVDLPAGAGTLTEILGEAHAAWDARLFVA